MKKPMTIDERHIARLARAYITRLHPTPMGAAETHFKCIRRGAYFLHPGKQNAKHVAPTVKNLVNAAVQVLRSK